MAFNKLLQPSADYANEQNTPAHCRLCKRTKYPSPLPIMQMNGIFQSSVGADLSRPPPLYRPVLHLSISGLFHQYTLSARAENSMKDSNFAS
jgi:hypothetical protein